MKLCCSITLKLVMNGEISVFCICVEAIMYLLLYNLHDCTFKEKFPVGSPFLVKEDSLIRLFHGSTEVH